MTIDENRLISLCRLLIGTEHLRNPETGIQIPQSPRDFCCNVHAIVASLVFAAFRIKTRIAVGRACIFTAAGLMPVLNHRFVVRESDNAIFDSSMEWPIIGIDGCGLRFAGISFAGSVNNKPLQIAYRRSNPSKSDLDEFLAQGKGSPIILYVEDRADAPEKLLEHKIVDGRYSEWADKTFGAQYHLTARFAAVVIDEIKSTQLPNPVDRSYLIQKVLSTSPDVAHSLRTICRKI